MATLAPTATETPTVFPTEAPTSTATPTETAELEPEIPAGWAEYGTDEITIQLPDSYACGNPQTEAAAIIDSLRTKGVSIQDEAGLQSLLHSYPPEFILFGADSFMENPDFMVNFSMLYQTVDPNQPMADAVNSILASLAQDYTLSEQRQMVNRFFEMQEATMIPKNPAQENLRTAVYIMKSEDVLLGLIFTATTDEWNDRLDQFDKIAKSIRLVLPEPTPEAIA
jgi:hypothetical protein